MNKSRGKYLAELALKNQCSEDIIDNPNHEATRRIQTALVDDTEVIEVGVVTQSCDASVDTNKNAEQNHLYQLVAYDSSSDEERDFSPGSSDDPTFQPHLDYLLHIIRKGQCNEAKKNDKVKFQEDSTFRTCTFDLQSVLQLPHLNVSEFYYSGKLCVYTLAIYIEDGETAHCYTWNEVHGKRGNNEIGSILFHFFKSLPVTVSAISMFSDKMWWIEQKPASGSNFGVCRSIFTSFEQCRAQIFKVWTFLYGM